MLWWELSTSTHFVHSIHLLSEVFPVVFTMQRLQISCWSSWPTTGRLFKCLRKHNCQCRRKSMQRLIVFSVPSAALGKWNKKPVKLNVKLDNFHDYSATFLVKFTPLHLHEERAAVMHDFCVCTTNFQCFVLSSQLTCTPLQVNQPLFLAGKSSSDTFLISKVMKRNCLPRCAFKGLILLLPFLAFFAFAMQKKSCCSYSVTQHFTKS